MIAHAPANKGRKLPPEPLSPDEVRTLIRACSKRAATGIRNRALIVVLYRAGLRVSEALTLLPKDLDATASTIRVLHGKGDHDRVVGLDAGAWAILQLWLDRRAAAGINGHARVFCTLKGKPVKSAYVRTLLPRLACKAGIAKRVHAHGLRHTHAFELATEGTPLHTLTCPLHTGEASGTQLSSVVRSTRAKQNDLAETQALLYQRFDVRLGFLLIIRRKWNYRLASFLLRLRPTNSRAIEVTRRVAIEVHCAEPKHAFACSRVELLDVH
jgi:site-specific recombinase XerD